MLTFYRSIEEAERYAPCGAVYWPNNKTTPTVQLVVPVTSASVQAVRLYEGVDYTFIPFPATGQPLGVTRKRNGEKDCFTIPSYDYSFSPIPQRCTCAYLRFDMDDGSFWYSNRFQFTDDIEQKLKIEWSNSCAIGGHDYSNHTGVMYLDTELAQPENEKIVTSEEQGDGTISVVSQSVKKTRRFEILDGNESLYDILSFISIHDTITITTRSEIDGNDVPSSVIPVFEMQVQDVSWRDDVKMEASVTFTQNQTLNNTGCCDGGCETGDYSVIGVVQPVQQTSIEAGPPSEGDSYFISTGATGGSSWDANVMSVAEWNGTSWNFTPTDIGETVNAGGVFYERIEGDLMQYPYLESSASTVTALIPKNSAAFVRVQNEPSPAATVHAEYYLGRTTLANGIDVSGFPSGVVEVEIDDRDNCGYSETPVTISY